MRYMRAMLVTLLASALLVALGLGFGPAAQGAPVEEDSPKFNCYTMGDRSCGSSPVVKIRRGGKVYRVAVLQQNEDGRHYGSHRSGKVFRLTRAEERFVWAKAPWFGPAPWMPEVTA